MQRRANGDLGAASPPQAPPLMATNDRVGVYERRSRPRTPIETCLTSRNRQIHTFRALADQRELGEVVGDERDAVVDRVHTTPSTRQHRHPRAAIPVHDVQRPLEDPKPLHQVTTIADYHRVWLVELCDILPIRPRAQIEDVQQSSVGQWVRR